MGRKRHTAEQIIGKLRTAEIELAKGLGMAEVVRKLGIAEQTYYLYGLLPLGKRNFRTA